MRDFPIPASPSTSTACAPESCTLLHRALEEPELLAAPGQRRQACAACGVEMALRAAFSDDAVQGDDVREPFDLVRPERTEVEEPAHDPVRVLAHHHGPRRRDVLNARREIRSLAKRQLLAPLTAPDVAHGDRPRVNSQPRVQLGARSSWSRRLSTASPARISRPLRTARRASSSCATG